MLECHEIYRLSNLIEKIHPNEFLASVPNKLILQYIEVVKVEAIY